MRRRSIAFELPLHRGGTRLDANGLPNGFGRRRDGYVTNDARHVEDRLSEGWERRKRPDAWFPSFENSLALVAKRSLAGRHEAKLQQPISVNAEAQSAGQSLTVCEYDK